MSNFDCSFMQPICIENKVVKNQDLFLVHECGG